MRAASSKRSWPIPNSACPRDAERHWPILPVVPTTALPTSRRPSPTSLAYGSTLSWTRQPPLAILTCGTYVRSEEHTSELQSLMRISYAVFCLKQKNKNKRKYNVRHTSTNKQDQ